MPKVSVIVPVYKVEKYLSRCVDSILNQSFTDFELILVDDGSPDNCPQICDEYAKKDNRIIVIHKKNGGLSDARNKGIDYAFENSSSEWLTFIDSDDWVHKDYLKFLYDANMKNKTKISYCKFLSVTKTESFFNEINNNSVKLYEPEECYCKNNKYITQACCSLYKKELFSEIRFPYGKYCEDVYITHELLFKTDKVSVLPYNLYYYFQNNESIMHNVSEKRLVDEIKGNEKAVLFFKNTKFVNAYKKSIVLYNFNLFYNFKHYKKNIYNILKNINPEILTINNIFLSVFFKYQYLEAKNHINIIKNIKSFFINLKFVLVLLIFYIKFMKYKRGTI